MRNRVHENPVVKNRIEFKELCEESNGTRTVAEITLKKGGKVPLHYHYEFSEYYEVLEGQLKMQIGNDIRTLRKGDYVLIPIKTDHRYFNDSDSEVKFKVVIQPGNMGYQLLVSVLNGLARDGKVNKDGLPTNWLIRGYLSVAAGSNVPGFLSWMQPVLDRLYKIAIRKGIDKQLLAKYYV